MMRLSTFIWPIMIVLAAVALFKLKHSVENVHRQVASTQELIEEQQKAIDVLKGEWSMLNRAPYLADLVRRHIPEGKIGQSDLGTLSSVPSRELYEGTNALPVSTTIQFSPAPIEIPILTDENTDAGSLRHIQEPDLIGEFLQRQNLAN